MICTEEEAKTKWCPMARVSGVIKDGSLSAIANRDISLLVPTNSFDPATDLTKCIASGCMMWWIPATPLNENRGYCGLAWRG